MDKIQWDQVKLSQVRQELDNFKDSLLYKLFQEECQQAEDMLIDMVTSAQPDGIAALIVREQATGSLSQVRIDKYWFETKQSELEQLAQTEKNNV